MATNFTWVPIYKEFAKVLSGWQNKQRELITFLEDLRSQDYLITPLLDQDENGERFLFKEIDPFTFFGVFNRGIRYDKRIAIISKIKQYFNIQSDLPSDFNGVPVINNMKSWFIPFQALRDVDDVVRLWRVFQLALNDDPLSNKDFLQAFDDALTVKQTNINLTMGLFWIRPETFLNLDQTNRSFLNIKLPPTGLNAKYYVETLRSVSIKWKSFPELSYEAWLATKKTQPNSFQPPAVPLIGDINYWLVGAYWDDNDPPDQTKHFLDEGLWQNGYEDRYLDDVKSMHVGDKIAIKSSSTQRQGLPFDNRNKTVSRMTIKAAGTIVANRNDGKTVEVEWDPNFQEKTWYFFTNRNTVWHLRTDDDYVHKKYSTQLIAFVWHDKAQDYEWFCKQWWEQDNISNLSSSLVMPEVTKQPYSTEDVIASGVFLNESDLQLMIDRLSVKKAMILQGAPGVGKTFIAKKLAYALMEEKNDARIDMIQFHQSYSYDDFVRGYRPLPGQPGTFGLEDGIFYEFCQKAIKDPDSKYVFIIDEINRGNLSQIFGELLMLIEHDKRGKEFSVPLVYRKQQDEPRFFVPHNLYLIGLMNLADRSLAMVDYALRRRFAFMTLKPQYESVLYRKWLLDRSMSSDLIDLIITRMTALNKEINEDSLLGENYQIGHSFFCPKSDNFAELKKKWYLDIVQTEISPLLKEYWYDNQMKAEEAERRLLA